MWTGGKTTTTAGTTTVDREEASPAKAAKKTAPNQEQRLGWGRCNRGRRAEARKEQRQPPAQGGWSDRGRQARALARLLPGAMWKAVRRVQAHMRGETNYEDYKQ